jgi:hypothetical protein
MAHTQGARLCGPQPPTAEDLAIVATFRQWLAGDRAQWDDQGLPKRPAEGDPAALAAEQAWASINKPDSLCPCGHPWGIHDVDEYRGDGSEMCCVTGCPQTGCPGRRPREQWESSSEEGA